MTSILPTLTLPCPAVVELCSTYDHVLGQDACSTRAAEVCAAALAGEQSVPAAVVLHSLLTNLFHKPVSGG